MADFQSSVPNTLPNEAAGLVQVETTKPMYGLPHQSLDTGPSDPDAVRLAVSDALDREFVSRSGCQVR